MVRGSTRCVTSPDSADPFSTSVLAFSINTRRVQKLGRPWQMFCFRVGVWTGWGGGGEIACRRTRERDT
eukprot:2865949-Rhodomonas_salina.1